MDNFFLGDVSPERVYVAVPLGKRFVKVSFWAPAVLTEVFYGFLHYVQENSGYFLYLAHDYLLPNPFQVIISAIVALNIINFTMFVTETWCVSCGVGVEFINIIQGHFECLN